MSFARVAAVTGANKGIGFAVVRNIALQYPKSPLNSGPLLIYLTARDPTRGAQAVKSINEDKQLNDAKALKAHGGLTSVEYHALDVSADKSIHDFAIFLKEKHPDGIDILVNNAGIAMDGFGPEVVDKTLGCNYYGLKQMTEETLPLIKPGGRVVNVASMTGKLNKYSAEIISRFQNATTTDQISSLMQDFSKSVQAGTYEKDGWPGAAYSVSKAGVIGYTQVLARQQHGRELLINACCPGYVSTDMTKHRGRKTVDEGAATPVKLAVGDLGGVSGEFWEHEDVSSW